MPDLFQDRAEGRAGGGGEGALAPQIFAKKKKKKKKKILKKLNNSKITEPKTAPPPRPLRNLLRGPCVYGTGKILNKRFETSARLLYTSKVI